MGMVCENDRASKRTRRWAKRFFGCPSGGGMSYANATAVELLREEACWANKYSFYSHYPTPDLSTKSFYEGVLHILAAHCVRHF